MVAKGVETTEKPVVSESSNAAMDAVCKEDPSNSELTSESTSKSSSSTKDKLMCDNYSDNDGSSSRTNLASKMRQPRAIDEARKKFRLRTELAQVIGGIRRDLSRIDQIASRLLQTEERQRAEEESIYEPFSSTVDKITPETYLASVPSTSRIDAVSEMMTHEMKLPLGKESPVTELLLKDPLARIRQLEWRLLQLENQTRGEDDVVTMYKNPMQHPCYDTEATDAIHIEDPSTSESVSSEHSSTEDKMMPENYFDGYGNSHPEYVILQLGGATKEYLTLLNVQNIKKYESIYLRYGKEFFKLGFQYMKWYEEEKQRMEKMRKNNEVVRNGGEQDIRIEVKMNEEFTSETAIGGTEEDRSTYQVQRKTSWKEGSPHSVDHSSGSESITDHTRLSTAEERIAELGQHLVTAIEELMRRREDMASRDDLVENWTQDPRLLPLGSSDKTVEKTVLPQKGVADDGLLPTSKQMVVAEEQMRSTDKLPLQRRPATDDWTSADLEESGSTAKKKC